MSYKLNTPFVRESPVRSVMFKLMGMLNTTTRTFEDIDVNLFLTSNKLSISIKLDNNNFLASKRFNYFFKDKEKILLTKEKLKNIISLLDSTDQDSKNLGINYLYEFAGIKNIEKFAINVAKKLEEI